MGQPDPDRPDRRVDKVFASASRSGPRGTEGYRRLVVGKGSLMVQRAACSAGAHHRGLETGGHLHVQSSQCCIRTGWVSAAWGERLTDVPGWLALPRSQDRHNPRSGPRMPCWRGCRPEGLQEAAEASGGAIDGTISPEEIWAAVTFAPRRCCLLTEMVPVGLQSPIGQERSSDGNQDGDDVCVGP